VQQGRQDHLRRCRPQRVRVSITAGRAQPQRAHDENHRVPPVLCPDRRLSPAARRLRRDLGAERPTRPRRPCELIAERCPDLHHCDTVRHGSVHGAQANVVIRAGAVDCPPATRVITQYLPKLSPNEAAPATRYHLLDGRRPSGGRRRRGLNAVERHPRQLFNCGKSSSRNSVAGRSPDSFSRPRSSTRRILPEIVFGSSANSSRRIRL
jgi:hypothetical protein